MYVMLTPRNLNLEPCPLHLTSTYICKVTIVPRVYYGKRKMIYVYVDGWGICPLHLTSTYTCKVTITPKVYYGKKKT